MPACSYQARTKFAYCGPKVTRGQMHDEVNRTTASDTRSRIPKFRPGKQQFEIVPAGGDVPSLGSRILVWCVRWISLGMLSDGWQYGDKIYGAPAIQFRVVHSFPLPGPHPLLAFKEGSNPKTKPFGRSHGAWPSSVASTEPANGSVAS